MIQHGLILCVIQILLSSCYTLSQAWTFNDLYNSRVLVDEVLADDSQPEALKLRLKWSREVMDYAALQGLNSQGAYRYYIHTDQPAVSFLVQAAHVDRLQWVTWWFPIVGRVPYLGFFSLDKRDTKALELESRGYDVARGQVGAFSSLGWFEDPIYRPMLYRPKEELAHLLFHELIHRSLWIRGQVEFNENLAEFGAEVLIQRFLKERGKLKQLKTYQERRLDREDYRLWIRDLRQALQSIYRDSNLSRDQKLQAKEKTFQVFVTERVPQFRTNSYGFIQKRQWNNAYVMGASLYAPDYSRFYQAFECVGEPKFGEFLLALEQTLRRHSDPFSALDALCQNRLP